MKTISEKLAVIILEHQGYETAVTSSTLISLIESFADLFMSSDTSHDDILDRVESMAWIEEDDEVFVMTIYNNFRYQYENKKDLKKEIMQSYYNN